MTASATTYGPTVADVAGRVLADLGVGHAFGVVGSGNFVMTNALRAGGVGFTAARHEGGAASMADAYSRMSGRVGVLTVHQGCGLTNAVTGIGEAAKSRTPMIVLTADAPAAALQSNFRIDQDELATSVGAVSDRVYGPNTVVADVTRAYRTAVTQRRTVVLNIAIDVAAAPVEVPGPVAASFGAPRIRPDAASAETLVAAIRAARRPVFVAGRGGREAGPQIAELAEASGALLATSAVANGLFAGNPFSLGISGGFSSPTTAELIAGADLIVGWGCALNMWTMRHGRLIGDQTVVAQVDVEVEAIGAHRPVDVGVVGDCAATAADALAALSGDPLSHNGYRTDDVAERIAASARWQDVPVTAEPVDGRIDPRALSIALDEILPADRILSIDSGNFMGYPSTHLSVPDEFGFCFTQAFQSIGVGLGTAIGAAIAQPARLPVLGTGDGGFLMAISELETAVRLALPLVVIVYNDSAYGAEVHHFGDADMTTVTFPETDIAAIARGHGATGVTVTGFDDLDEVRRWVASLDSPEPSGPLVIDAKITNDGGSWWLAEAFAGH
ncbi:MULTISPECIES: thiamine pyrophosphate-binding protein [Gordonia]|uniref:acetolactate synthase n=2 Tax=Gordonia alkanivorans TaxID=84096 RepID=F9VU71_9ACTN|nr:MULTISPECIES: thiamine pyrophosphate-binding protein [Gordonia]ETA05940.1 acetolactate synthase [Gordonia alkanivorans CGMCC 6845]MDH3009066.1 thiamine pyrophosphate-binding protein [Gordonia alkanivorans]MDH3012907.1 thiamine pyrophosphate-binding protein [Gordonia alkanivorans]MDH3018001.1 thiamine pyrophosphate-binding protein [Gordonia alkanivorans]MDH3021922.1 thiamine pyrophosphate-binding protein [Gordonia alkanivorans]